MRARCGVDRAVTWYGRNLDVIVVVTAFVALNVLLAVVVTR